jgi:hypothetical protein
VLGWTPGDPSIAAGAAAVTGACLFWALDNNLTRLIAEGDPLLIVEVKGSLPAPSTSCSLSRAARRRRHRARSPSVLPSAR